MTDQATDGVQNMNIQDFQGSEFDPFGPQHGKLANIQSNGGAQVDLLGGNMDPEITNGHERLVSFDPGMPAGQSDGYGSGRSSQEKVQRHMSTGEILGYQNEYGESHITGQMEYEGYSDEEYGENAGDYSVGRNGPPVLPEPQTDQDYYMSTGQPLVDLGGVENVPPSGGHVGQQPQLVEHYDQNTGYYSSEGYDQGVGYDTQQYTQDRQYTDDYCDNDETDPGSWAPEMDAERARRSLSPERSVSPRDVTSQSGADLISSPQYDTDSYADTGDISSPSEMIHNPLQSDPNSFIPASEIPGSPGRGITSPQPSITESESSFADSKGSPRHKIPRPKKKKPLELPPWDDNVVIPPLPRMKPTMIGKQADLPPPSSPQRPRTAPLHFTRKDNRLSGLKEEAEMKKSLKDASSDSGVEDDKAAKSPRKSTGESKLKRYGTDSKNQAYKPGGGNIAIFDQKVDMKTVGSRTDSTRPKSSMSPRTSVSDRSPSTPKPPTPNTRNVQSRVGSLNNVKHKPGGGVVTVLSTKTDFTNVKSKVGSKDKISHKPKGGEKKIESQKLAWKAESKVGSLKNATHSPGGGNVQILDEKVDIKAKSKVGSTVNLKHKAGGGDKKIETQKLEFTEKAKSKVGSMDRIKHKPGGGDVQVYNESLKWNTESRVQSLANIKHKAGGGDVQVLSEKIQWTARSRVQSNINTTYTPRGGNVQILDEKVDFTDKAKSKVGSMDMIKHQPGGGEVKVNIL